MRCGHWQPLLAIHGFIELVSRMPAITSQACKGSDYLKPNPIPENIVSVVEEALFRHVLAIPRVGCMIPVLWAQYMYRYGTLVKPCGKRKIVKHEVFSAPLLVDPFS